VSITRRTATLRSKWFVPTRTENEVSTIAATRTIAEA
jgi:hypothetical protein